MKIVEMFFGSAEELRQTLVDKLKAKRKDLGIGAKELDAVCGFGRQGPSTAQFEEDSFLLTSRIFCRAALVLELNVDDVMKVDMDVPGRKEFVLRHMDDHGARLLAKWGTGDLSDVTKEEQAGVYAVLRALEEMDET